MVREFDFFLKQVAPKLDLNWRKYRRKGARRRVQRRMQTLGMHSFDQYRDYVLRNNQEASLLPEIMLVTVSRFFRDRHCWSGLAESVLPRICERSEKRVRILSAGACGGEEPYSLALVWNERIQPLFSDLEPEIIALELDSSNLARAAKGEYGPSTLREVDPHLREKWFTLQNHTYSLDPAIRKLVRFERKHILQDPLPFRCDLVLCRYLAFTYYVRERLHLAACRFWESLVPGGCLFIGLKEELPPRERAMFSQDSSYPCFWWKETAHSS